MTGTDRGREPRQVGVDESLSESTHSVLLAGVGADAHSVGLIILRRALAANGYEVMYLGTQNRLSVVFELAPAVNLVMLSCMDGHARYYLDDYEDLKRSLDASTLWYLGGNPVVDRKDEAEREFRQKGFDRVFTGFVDVRTVLALVKEDLRDVPTKRAPADRLPRLPSSTRQPHPDRMNSADFEDDRRTVLDGWPTGADCADLDDNGRFLAEQPSFAEAQARVNRGEANILIQPRVGVPLIDEQQALLAEFEDAGCRVLSYQVDSLTRSNDYRGAQIELEEAKEAKEHTLNGFPVVNHGKLVLRQIAESIAVPLQVRHSTHDPRLLAEVSLAGGVTSFEGGPISYDVPYFRDYPIGESIRDWQYVERLVGIYWERYGVVVDREFFGPLTATLIPACLAASTGILEALLAVEQGVRCVSIGYAEQGHRPQDIAALRVIRSLAAEYLSRFGDSDIQINTVFHEYMAAFPLHASRAKELIEESAATAALAGATRIIAKSPVEAIQIPDLEANLAGIRQTELGIEDARSGRDRADESAIAAEFELIESETRAILDTTLSLGSGSIASGIVEAFERGVIDVPFSPSIYNRGEAWTARDSDGAIRFLRFGGLPFGDDIKSFHMQRMAERFNSEGLDEKDSYLLVERDVLQIELEQYRHWPLHL